MGRHVFAPTDTFPYVSLEPCGHYTDSFTVPTTTPRFCVNPCISCCCYMGPTYCCSCGGNSQTNSLVDRIAERAGHGFVMRFSEICAIKYTGCLGSATSNQQEDIYFELDGPWGSNALETHLETFDVTFNVVPSATGRSTVQHGQDIEAMAAKINTFTAQGWALKSIYDSPAMVTRGLSSAYSRQFVCCLYRPMDTTLRSIQKVTMLSVECTGVEHHVSMGSGQDRMRVFDRREMDLRNVQDAIHNQYQLGARMVTAIDIEGEVVETGEHMQVEVIRRYHLFFERTSKTVPHVALLATGPRTRMRDSFCKFRKFYDTQLIRSCWTNANSAGWQIAGVFDTGSERIQRESLTEGTTTSLKEAMFVFDAPVSGLKPGQQPGVYEPEHKMQLKAKGWLGVNPDAPSNAISTPIDPELMEEMRKQFVRYDADDSGTVNTLEELQQLVTKLYFDLALKKAVERIRPHVIAMRVHTAGDLTLKRWTFEQWLDWLRQAFPEICAYRSACVTV